MKTLLILALLAALLTLGCRAEDPVIPPPVPQAAEGEPLSPMREVPATATPEIRPTRALARPTARPEPTFTPTPPPTATAAPNILERVVSSHHATARASVGICYRTPAVQEWIISYLQIQSCAVITNHELYRITSPVGFTGLKPGDLDGLVNVESLVISDGHCGDWENPQYAASILDGFNREAALLIGGQFLYAIGQGPGPRQSIISLGMYETDMYPEAVRRRFDDGLIDSGLTDAQIASLLKRGAVIKMQVNAQARAIAAAVAETRWVENPVIRITNLGTAVIGKTPETGSVDVRLELLHRPNDLLECQDG